MKRITLRLSDDLFAAIDKSFSKSKYKIKNDYLTSLLTKCLIVSEPSICNVLPDIVNDLLDHKLAEYEKDLKDVSKECVKATELAIVKLLAMTEALSDYIPREVITDINSNDFMIK